MTNYNSITGNFGITTKSALTVTSLGVELEAGFDIHIYEVAKQIDSDWYKVEFDCPDFSRNTQTIQGTKSELVSAGIL